MPEAHKDSIQAIQAFIKTFKEWESCFVGPMPRGQYQTGPDTALLKKRQKAREDMEQAFKLMLKKTNY